MILQRASVRGGVMNCGAPSKLIFRDPNLFCWGKRNPLNNVVVKIIKSLSLDKITVIVFSHNLR